MAIDLDALNRARSDLLFGVRRSVRYHARRRRHFDRFHRCVTFLALLFGSATFAALIGKLESEWIALGASAIVAISAALDLVIGSTTRARDHHDFERKWIALERELIRAGDYDAEKQAVFIEKRLAIEAEEEPPMRVLDILCHNELVRSMNRDDDRYKVGPLQRMLSQWIDWRPDTVEKLNREAPQAR